MSLTFVWMRSLAAALPDSVARNAFVTATLILSSSKATTLPFLLITLSFPGAVITNSSFATYGCCADVCFVVCSSRKSINFASKYQCSFLCNRSFLSG
jgi:hypothetical protein